MDGYLKENKVSQDMLKNAIKFSIIPFLILISSCVRKELSVAEISIITENVKRLSKKQIGEKEYLNIYHQANDSLKVWSETKLETYAPIWTFKYKLETTLCFNSEKDKMVGAILVQCNQDGCSTDDIHHFYGVKIKGKWYFFMGADMVLIRSYYQQDSETPLTFDKMHELAVKYLFKGYIKKSLWNKIKTGNWYIINDHFFDDLTSVAYCVDCKTKEDFDKAYLRWVVDNWKHRDTTTYNSDH